VKIRRREPTLPFHLFLGVTEESLSNRSLLFLLEPFVDHFAVCIPVHIVY
jgi:hypothetical protein